MWVFPHLPIHKSQCIMWKYAVVEPRGTAWGATISNVSKLASQSQSRYFEPDGRDWRGRSGQPTSFGNERSWDSIHDNKESNISISGYQEVKQSNKQGSQFPSSAQVSSTQVVTY
ncbi:hypothetical protein B296_00035834 [Ensete ventricosum]|uniref:Uncharacterized protein n=1 Tax=Ensete ventricosum TaxID=4639 RepID=A0A427A4H3_ENSVE|nr:hypothetical protein B296_00035834 [Ensete ventricosum]